MYRAKFPWDSGNPLGRIYVISNPLGGSSSSVWLISRRNRGRRCDDRTLLARPCGIGSTQVTHSPRNREVVLFWSI